MKKLLNVLCLTLLLPTLSYAQVNTTGPFTPSGSSSQGEVARYIKNIASYFGIPAEKAYSGGGSGDSQFPKTPDIAVMSGTWAALITNFTPTSSSIPSSLITTLVFNTAYLAATKATAVDQSVSNATPTQQAIVNFLSTPEDCSAAGGTTTVSQDGSMQCIPVPAIASQVAKLPITPLYKPSLLPSGAAPASGTQQQPGQTQGYNTANDALNLNALLRPLSFNTQSTQSQQSAGLTNAINYIRFVTNQMTPVTMPTYKTYASYTAALQSPKSPGDSGYSDYISALNAFNKFQANLRAYVAFASIATSNFNQLLARRLKAPGAATSQAQADYVMATRRLFVPGSNNPSDASSASSGQQTQWYQQMEKAPPITVQREMLYLLSEMNYQMYQMRMIQERELATLSAMQMQNLVPSGSSTVTLQPLDGSTSGGSTSN